MYRGNKIGLIIPAFNEEENIERTLSLLPDYLDHILVVDDGSADRTAALAKANDVNVISHRVNKGVGATFRTGVKAILATEVDIAVNMDADGQFDSKDIEKLLDPIIDGQAEFVTASRFMDKSMIPEMPAIKKWGNFQMSRLISWLTGRKFYDVSCGFRAYSREVLYKMNLFGSFTYTQETFIDLAFKQIDILEVPVVVLGKRAIGKSRIASNLFRYTYQTSKIILKTFRDYRPFKLFGFFSLILFIIGILLLMYMFYFKLSTGSFSPYKWLGFAGGAVVLSGFISLLIGFVMDMFARMRHNQEEILFHLKKGNEHSR